MSDDLGDHQGHVWTTKVMPVLSNSCTSHQRSIQVRNFMPVSLSVLKPHVRVTKSTAKSEKACLRHRGPLRVTRIYLESSKSYSCHQGHVWDANVSSESQRSTHLTVAMIMSKSLRSDQGDQDQILLTNLKHKSETGHGCQTSASQTSIRSCINSEETLPSTDQ